MTARDRRALWVGGALVLGALFALRVVPALWRGWHASREELVAQRELLVRADRALDQLDTLESRATRTRAALVALAPRLVSGRTSAEAQVDLNGRLALIANRERTRLVRADPMIDSTREGQLHRVRMRIEVESDWAGLVGFLRGVVGDPATLRVTSVSLRGAEVPTMTSGAEVLAGEVEVTGWYLEPRRAEAGAAR
jgi:hypothetical protein